MQTSSIFVIESARSLSEIIQNCIDSHYLDTKADAQQKKYLVESIESSTLAFDMLKSRFGEVNFEPINNVLVFVDLFLDDCDGLSLIEKLRNDYHGLKIVAFLPESSIAQGAIENLELRNQAESAGANATLIAPYNLHEIVASVTRLTEQTTHTITAPSTTTLQTHQAAV